MSTTAALIRREREALDAALNWLHRRQCDPRPSAHVPIKHRAVLDDVVHAVLLELERREQAGKPCRRIRWMGRTWCVRYTSFQRVLLIEQRTGAVLASRFGWVH